jgi:hypothetical protein
MLAKSLGMTGGNRNGYYFINDKEHKFTLSEIHDYFAENREMYKLMYGYIVPVLSQNLSTVSPERNRVVAEEFDY